MNILIVGGGISGVSAAKVILAEKHNVTIVESTPESGGLMARIANCRVGFKTFFDEIRNDERLDLITGARISKATKENNSFLLTLDDGRTLTADKVIIAAGLTPYDPIEYTGKRIITSLEYDALIDQRQSELPADFNKIGFFLCVGSRSKEYPLCSSVCCSYTLREVKWTLQRGKPDISVFYNDLRFFGQEFYMEKAFRDAGVKFIRANSRYFEEDENGVIVRYYSESQLKEVRLDYAVLAIGLRPNPGLAELSDIFGFSLNKYGFVNEYEVLQTDIEDVFVSGGALEPMNIKDSILTGFGAGMLSVKGSEFDINNTINHEHFYRETAPDFILDDAGSDSFLFYLGTDFVGNGIFYEFVSSVFISEARRLKTNGKTVYVLTRNMVSPSYGEIEYETARREGIIFIHLEESDKITFNENIVEILREGHESSSINADRIVLFDDYANLFKDREFLSLYRSEPQIRWSPTKWGRKRYHVGFIRHPRDLRWEKREILGALGEMILDTKEERILPHVDEDRCSGCGSCKEACPQSAIDMLIHERHVSIFGPIDSSKAPIAHIKEDVCVGCGLCASACPSDVISHEL